LIKEKESILTAAPLLSCFFLILKRANTGRWYGCVQPYLCSPKDLEILRCLGLWGEVGMGARYRRVPPVRVLNKISDTFLRIAGFVLDVVWRRGTVLSGHTSGRRNCHLSSKLDQSLISPGMWYGRVVRRRPAVLVVAKTSGPLNSIFFLSNFFI
jgi:hypothetical protein